MTARTDKYENYRQGARACGASEADIEFAVADMKAMDEKIDAGVCPRCGSRITRAEDPRQAGPTEIAGKWFNYHCTASPLLCGWFADQCEPVGEN